MLKNIYLSGTSTKVLNRLNPDLSISWTNEDNCMMKCLNNSKGKEYDDILQFMVNRHSSQILEEINNQNNLRDYEKYPTPVLIRRQIPLNFQNLIKKDNGHFNFNCIFNLKQTKTPSGFVFEEEFDLEKSQDGIDILIDFFESIISENKNKKTLFKELNETQKKYGSRTSTIKEPKLFLIFIDPVSSYGSIDQRQNAFINFLNKHTLWQNFLLKKCNSKENNSYEYNNYIKNIMAETKKLNKEGCILFLGNCGTTGVNYYDCDVTISLDNGYSLDSQVQKMERCGTPVEGKTISINVDYNINRSLLFYLTIINNYKKFSNTTLTNQEILCYLYEHNIYLFDPKDLEYGSVKSKLIEYCKNISNEIAENIDDNYLLSNICIKEDFLRNAGIEFSKNKAIAVDELTGLHINEEFSKSDTTKTRVDSVSSRILKDLDEETIKEIENITNEVFKRFLIPLICLLCKSYNIRDHLEIFRNDDTSNIVQQIFVSKFNLKNSVDINVYYSEIVSLMENALKENNEIICQIREIYENASPLRLRNLIAKHFIPSREEQTNNAEIPTPVFLVDEMLKIIPESFWKKQRKVFEPCCGKGNFILGIFDKFYKGLEKKYPDKVERCSVIINECISYADLSALNVFITTELLKCHIQNYCKNNVELTFNYFIGNSLDLKDLNGFHAIIGNPPYNSSGGKNSGNTIWQHFTKVSLNTWLTKNGYLLFVHPPGWRKPNTIRGAFNGMFELMTKQNQLLYLEIHGVDDGKKTFKCGTRYDWYLIQNTLPKINSIIIDENSKKITIDLKNFNWLPNSNILEINKLLEGNEKCKIVYSPSLYEHRKPWMSHTLTKEYIYPCIHSTPKTGTRYMYSKHNDKGHFKIPKVIFGESGINEVIIDIEGSYGLTNGAIGIEVTDLEHATKIKNALESDKFQSILKSCMFSSFRLDWNFFKELKNDFYLDFI